MKHISFWQKNYPRPQFVRKKWTNLNGEWDFAFDKDGSGRDKGYFNGFETAQKITVPYAYQVKASGIGDPTLCENIWYQRKIELSPEKNKRVLLHLEGCDYETRVWLNGVDCGGDKGGYHRLTFDLTEGAKKGENLLVIAVKDDYSTEKPRGKQRWKAEDFGCWYIDTSGIYKTAWLEEVSDSYVNGAKLTPDVENGLITAELDIVNGGGCEISCTVTYGGKEVCRKACAADGECVLTLPLGENVRLWNVGAPELYELKFELTRGKEVCDEVYSYAGMREVKIEDGKILLNGKPLYQKLVLDQGYWDGYGLTPPSEEALERDITQMTEMGFNGCRKHQKIEDERFLYYADVYGYIVWGEMPSMYSNTPASRETFKREWRLAAEQQYNHPCVLCWVPFNESWGIEQIKTDKVVQNFVNEVYYATKALDKTRPVITNDGWEHTVSDILTIHHYTQVGSVLYNAFNTVEKCTADKFDDHERGAFADGYSYNGQPVMITEFGGTAFVKDATGAKWGYGAGVNSGEEYIARFRSLIKAVDDIPFMCGYCYTQLSDVYHEVNGIVGFGREEKVPAETIKTILSENGR